MYASVCVVEKRQEAERREGRRKEEEGEGRREENSSNSSRAEREEEEGQRDRDRATHAEAVRPLPTRAQRSCNTLTSHSAGHPVPDR